MSLVDSNKCEMRVLCLAESRSRYSLVFIYSDLQEFGFTTTTTLQSKDISSTAL